MEAIVFDKDNYRLIMTAQVNNIGELLVKDSKLQQADLERALVVNDGNGIGPLLVRLGLVSDKDLASAYSWR